MNVREGSRLLWDDGALLSKTGINGFFRYLDIRPFRSFHVARYVWDTYSEYTLHCFEGWILDMCVEFSIV